MNNRINQKSRRAERPDRPLFMAMIGAFFIFFALAPAYWAFYNYGEYNRTEKMLSDWRQKPESIPKDSYGGDPFAIQKSRADRYRLEMILSAAGSLVLFGIALLLFGKALKSRGIKPEYEPLDWRVIPLPTNRVEVRYKSVYNILFALLVLFFGGMTLLISYQTFNSRFESANGKIIKGILFPVCLLKILSVIAFLQLRAKRQAVRLFDASGITRGDGRQFSWNEFRGVVTRRDFNFQTQRRYVWRVELAFADGEAAWIIPHRVKNYDEVFSYLAALPRAVLKATSEPPA